MTAASDARQLKEARSWFAYPSERALLIAFVLIAIPFVFLGVGPDSDSRLVLEGTIKPLLQTGTYIQSRGTGYPTHEFACTLLYVVGGVVLCNVGSLAMALLSGVAFTQFCREFEVPNAPWLLAAFLFHPIFFLNATCLIDYHWALAGILWGYLLLRRGRWILAGLLLGLAVGARIASGPPIAGLSIALLIESRSKLPLVVKCAAVAIAVAFCLYIPALVQCGWNLHAWLVVSIGDWPLFGYIARFVLRNAYFWGIQAVVIFVPIAYVQFSRRRPRFEATHRRLIWHAVLAIASMEALYARYPLEMAYLFAILPFSLLLLGVLLKDHKRLLKIFVLAVLSYNVVNFNLLRPKGAPESGAVDTSPRIDFGYVINVTQDRLFWIGAVSERSDYYFR